MNINTNRWNRIRYWCWAPIYDIIALPTRSLRRRSLALAGLQPGERVLIVGAGTGLDLDLIVPGLSITATDLTPAMLEKLRRRAQRLGRAVEARVIDGHSWRLPTAARTQRLRSLSPSSGSDSLSREAARAGDPGWPWSNPGKLAPDNGPLPLWLRFLNLASVLATDVTRRLGRSWRVPACASSTAKPQRSAASSRPRSR